MLLQCWVARNSKAICAWKLVVRVYWEQLDRLQCAALKCVPGPPDPHHWVCPVWSACKIWSHNDKTNRLEISQTLLLTFQTVCGLDPLKKYLSPPQSARDIESRMRNETRLKLFTLDPDTQVNKPKAHFSSLSPVWKWDPTWHFLIK